MENKTLQAAIVGAKNGNSEDFVALCTEKGRAILFLCYRELKNWQDAEDAAQEVMIRMYRKLNRLESADAFNVWLYRIVLSVCRDMHRKNMRHKNMVDVDGIRETLADDSVASLPQEYLENDAIRERVVGFVDELPEKYRQCILLHYYENLSYQEIASVMGIRVVTVDSYLRMGRKLLRARLELDGQASEGGSPYALSAVAIGPMLTDVLRWSAERTIPASMVNACVSSAEAGIKLSAQAAAAKLALAGKAGLIGTGVAAVLATAMLLSPYFQKQAPDGGGATGRPSLPQGEVSAGVPSAPDGASDYGYVVNIPGGVLEGQVFVETPTFQGTSARRGVSGVVLKLVDASAPETTLLRATTGPDGTFCFPGLATGSYRVLAVLPGGATPNDGAWQAHTAESGWIAPGGAMDILVEQEGPPEKLELQLALPVVVSGTVEAPNAGGCEVLLTAPDGEQIAGTFAAPDGTFAFDAFYLPYEGEYVVSAGDDMVVQESRVYLYPGYGLGYVEGP